MKITKLGHSCVLVETPDRVGLFDPGVWTNRELIDAVEHVDRIIYTHEHPDHFDIAILESLAAKFPHAHVVCNESIAKKIKEAGIQLLVRDETQCTRKFKSDHDSNLPIPGVLAPPQNGYHFKDLFTHPGDSHDFSETKKVLAIAFVSPWGTPRAAVDKVLELKPDYVLPVHDWLYNDESRKWLNGLIEKALEGSGVKQLSPKPGTRFEIV